MAVIDGGVCAADQWRSLQLGMTREVDTEAVAIQYAGTRQ